MNNTLLNALNLHDIDLELPASLARDLERTAAATGLPLGELIRRILQDHAEAHGVPMGTLQRLPRRAISPTAKS